MFCVRNRNNWYCGDSKGFDVKSMCLVDIFDFDEVVCVSFFVEKKIIEFVNDLRIGYELWFLFYWIVDSLG